jgi:DNA polymerase I
MSDGSGAYNRYYGRLTNGEVKIRGIMARKRDTPEYVKRMQLEMFDDLSRANCTEELHQVAPDARAVFERYVLKLEDADPRGFIMRRRIGRTRYEKRSLEASAVEAVRELGISHDPGVEVGYVVRDASTWAVSVEDDTSELDTGYYKKLLEKAWIEVSVLTFALEPWITLLPSSFSASSEKVIESLLKSPKNVLEDMGMD